MQDSARTDQRVCDVLELIASRFREPWSLETFAGHVNLSAPYLDRLFSGHTGTTPTVALKIARMERAAEMLCATHLRVKEVAAAVGIDDLPHFVRDFKNRYGQRPTVYRKSRKVRNGQ